MGLEGRGSWQGRAWRPEDARRLPAPSGGLRSGSCAACMAARPMRACMWAARPCMGSHRAGQHAPHAHAAELPAWARTRTHTHACGPQPPSRACMRARTALHVPSHAPCRSAHTHTRNATCLPRPCRRSCARARRLRGAPAAPSSSPSSTTRCVCRMGRACAQCARHTRAGVIAALRSSGVISDCPKS